MSNFDEPIKQNDLGGFTPSEIRKELARIVQSEQFSEGSQLADFLSYIVEETLAGREDQLKAYTIGVDALGRGEDFDPQESAVVRVAAGRLRQSLAIYNSQAPVDGRKLVISLQPGSYIPQFEPSGQQLIGPENLTSQMSGDAVDQIPEPQSIFRKIQQLTWVTSVLTLLVFSIISYLAYGLFKSDQPLIVGNNASIKTIPSISITLQLPDKPYPDWFNANELADSIDVVVARFDDYRYGGVTIADQTRAEPPTDSDYHLTITAHRRENEVRFFANLRQNATGINIWSTERHFSTPEKLTDRDQIELLGRAFSPVASPYGVIYANVTNKAQPRAQLECVVAGYRYFYSKSNEKHELARSCAESLVADGDEYPAIHAVLTFLHLDEYREGRNRRAHDPLAAAIRSAERAVELGPQSARAHQALFAVYKVQGLREKARKAAQKALALNPFDADINGDYAAWLISIGEVEQGQAYLDKVESLLDIRPAWLEFYRFLAARLSGNTEEAAWISRMMDMTRSPLTAVAYAIGAHERRDFEGVRLALKELDRGAPDFMKDPKSNFRNRGFDDEVANDLIEKLESMHLEVLSN